MFKFFVYFCLLLCSSVFVFRVFVHMHEYFYLDEDDQHALLFSENAFYYSFYHDAVVRADSLKQAFELLVHDNRSEYGHEINAIQRFNIFPELFFALLYRFGNALSSGQLGASLLSPLTFYLFGVVSVFGIGIVAFLRLARVLSKKQQQQQQQDENSSTSSTFEHLTSNFFDGWFAGCVTVLLAAINYHYVTRIQLHPPLRENFGVPFFLLQLTAVAKLLLRRGSARDQFELFLTTTMFLLVWQFAHFLLFLEVNLFICLFWFCVFYNL